MDRMGELEKRMEKLRDEENKDKAHYGEYLTYHELGLWLDEMRKDLPKFGDFTHECPDDLTAEDFCYPDILEFADFYGYITAMKEWHKKWLRKRVK